MSFVDALYNLGTMIEAQSNSGENKLRTLDKISPDGQTQRFEKLGDFANKFDSSAQRSYTEEGYFKHNHNKGQPKSLEVLLQEPDATVLVKKRAFSSLSENFRPELMDEQERFLHKTTKILFQNKCSQISAYEKLTKIEKISSELGYVDSSLVPIITSAVESFDFVTSGFSTAFDNGNISKFKAVLDKLKKATALSKRNIHTTWTPDLSKSSIAGKIGEGTGVIEFTNVSSFNCTSSINPGGGGCTLNFADPYELMVISNLDIEQAITDATNRILNNNYFQIGITSLQSSINTNIASLKIKRSSRNVSQVNFKIEPNTFLGKKVRAFIEDEGFEIQFDYSGLKGLVGLNQSDNIDPSSKFGSSEIGNDGLTDIEISIFNDIISGYYKLIELTENSKSQIKNNNDQTNYIRKKLRLYYGNKYLIQPMDVVHIYIGSKSFFDDKVIGGLRSSFSQLGFLQAANSSVSDIKTYLNINNSSSLEKSIFVGPDFPNALWAILKNQFVNNKNGTHVFAGVVSDSSGEYSGGAHRVSVSAKDNFSGYFDNGVVNFKPSVDVFNGPLYDPLTPFKIEFDSTTGIQKDSVPSLLEENNKLLGSTPAFVKYKQGPKAGQTPTHGNLHHDYDRAPNSLISRVYYDPDGFVYRWKEGIATYVLFGDNYSNPISPATPVPITENIFAGQDVMNIISLLVCGEPYNFATFFKGAKDFDSIGRDPTTGQDSSVSFFNTLKVALQKRNYLYGNFVPFKKLTMDEKSFEQILNNQLSVLNFDSQLQDLLKKRAELADKLVIINGRDEGPISDPQGRERAFQILNLDTQIYDRQVRIKEQLKESKYNLKISGDDVSFDFDSFLGTQSFKNESLHNPSIRRDLRRKVNYLTQRLFWKVKANEDTNLFVVDDAYDKDYDIQIFEKTIVGNFSLFQSQFSTPKEQILHVADKLNLEVFADSQGHLQVRIPQYNRVPSSVFYSMLKMKQDHGIEIFPKFIEDLFVTHLDSIVNNIEIIEDEIRLDCALLGKSDDTTAEGFVRGSKQTTGDIDFKFLSNENTGKILSNDMNIMKIFSSPDYQEASINKTLNIFSQQNKLSNVFDIIKRSNELIKNFDIKQNLTLSKPTLKAASVDAVAEATAFIDKVKNRIYMKTGQIAKVDEFKANISNGETFRIIQEISQKIAQRQKLIKSAVNAFKNITEGKSISENKNNTANKILFPHLYGSKDIPESFEHMIEDESYDDLGPGSGQRYIIRNSQIIRLSFKESPPEHTAITVTGSFGDLQIPSGSLPQDLNAFQGGGNALTTVAAVDYDLWRMYGVKIPRHIDAPFITDAQTQGAPYAVSLLNKARGEILKADATLVGNEYIQPGEVYYFENRDLLFYSESVTQSYSQSGQFQTSVRFIYGHNPGEYIPTPLDIIGKVFYKNKDITNFINYRQDNVYNHDHVGLVVSNFNQSPTSLEGKSFNITEGEFGSKNLKTIEKMLYTSAAIISKGSVDFKPKLELRIYFNSKKAGFAAPNKNLKEVAESLGKFLTGNGSLGDFSPKDNTPWLNGPFNSANSDVVLKEVDIASVDEFRFVSSKAFSEARNISGSKASSILDNQSSIDKVDNIIYNFIIDCWIAIPDK